MAHILAFAGAVLWMLSIAIVVQRQRVLARRLARLERMAGVRARPRQPWPLPLGRTNIVPPTSDCPPKPPPAGRYPISGDPWRPPSLPTVQQLAALARPLQRAGG